MGHTWDPHLYLAYSDERGRPFVELLARVAAVDPASVTDLGCGPGNLTALLADRWPAAAITGIDSSPEMIEAARAAEPRVAFEIADLRDWASGAGPVDVLVSNATLQWVPGHLALLPALVGRVRPGGWLAFQVPGNFEEPSHTIRRDLAARAPVRRAPARRRRPRRARRSHVSRRRWHRWAARWTRGRRPISTS